MVRSRIGAEVVTMAQWCDTARIHISTISQWHGATRCEAQIIHKYITLIIHLSSCTQMRYLARICVIPQYTHVFDRKEGHTNDFPTQYVTETRRCGGAQKSQSTPNAKH